jgi:hypothetical protein
MYIVKVRFFVYWYRRSPIITYFVLVVLFWKVCLFFRFLGVLGMDFLKVRFFVHWYRRLSIIPHFVLVVIYFTSVRFFFLCSESSSPRMSFSPLVSYLFPNSSRPGMFFYHVHIIFHGYSFSSSGIFFFCLYCVDGFLRWIVFVSVI